MPSVPPFSRSEKIEDYAAHCRSVRWQEKRIKSADGVEIALAVAGIHGSKGESNPEIAPKHVAIIYFQGNGGSIPSRLPLLSSMLKLLQQASPPSTRYTIIAPSYRGFWTSRGRPSEDGIRLDAAAAVRYTVNELPALTSESFNLVLWGQSIGAGVAASATAAVAGSHLTNDGAVIQREAQKVAGLLLETPFVSVRAMLMTLYPQKWLPYRYLGPFLRNHWDSKAALQEIAKRSLPRPKILILQAEKDELVPASQSAELEAISNDLKLDAKKRVVAGALHNEVLGKIKGRNRIAEFLREFG